MGDVATFDFPNTEVRAALARALVRRNFGIEESAVDSLMGNISGCLIDGDARKGLDAIGSLLGLIEGDTRFGWAHHCENVIALIFNMFGLDCRAEIKIDHRTFDALVETAAYVYCFSFRFDNDADEALAKIDHTDYSTPWQGHGKKLFKVGVGIDLKSRNIGNVKIAGESPEDVAQSNA